METWIWQLYENEIKFFEKMADKLLVEIIVQELKMDKRKHQKLEPTKEDIDYLVKKIESMLNAIAIIETFRYYQMSRIMLTNQNMQSFFAKRDEHFENLLMVLILKIRNEQQIDFNVREC